jgi:hypothetical protein
MGPVERDEIVPLHNGLCPNYLFTMQGPETLSYV